MRKGTKQTDEARQKMSETKSIPLEQRIAEDRERLRLMGQTNRFLWAEKFGCSEKTAIVRLNRLVDSGYAEKFRERGAIVNTYVTTIPPGAQLIGRRGPIQRRKDQEAQDES
jgi:hypothetical protein